MEIHPGLEIIGLGLFIRKRNILIISDTQIGYEESLNKQGLFLPRFQFNELMKKVRMIIEKTQPSLVVINGDLKHEFSTITRTEWKQALMLIDFLLSRAKVFLVRGNHDNMLAPIAEKRGLELKEHYVFDEFYVCHGHKIPEDRDFKMARTVIIGHAHPAIKLIEGGRAERYKCFLKGIFKGKTLIVQPSFNLLVEGSDVMGEKMLSPFLQGDIGEFEVFVADNELYYFGRIKDNL